MIKNINSLLEKILLIRKNNIMGEGESLNKKDEDFLDKIREGSLQEVQDLISKGADIHYKNDESIKLCATYGELDKLKYLLSLDKFKQKSLEEVFKETIYTNREEILNYLVFDYKMKVTNSLKKWSEVEYFPFFDSESLPYQTLKSVLDKKQLNDDLDKNLPKSNDNNSIKKKKL